MNVLFDASCLMKELTGVGVYVRDLLDRMIPMDETIRYTIFMNAMKGETPRFPWTQSPNVTIVRRRIPGKLLLESWRRNGPPSIETLAGCSPDLFHSPNFLYQRTGVIPVIATIHDLAFLKRPQYGDRYAGRYHRETLTRNLHRANRCVVVSHAVEQDLQQHCGVNPDRISVIHHGLNPLFSPTVRPQAMRYTQRFPRRFLLTVGSVEPRKNMPLLVKAFGRIVPDHPDLYLVIAGRAADGLIDLENAVREAGVSSRVQLTGYIDLDHLIALNQHALAAVFPSWDEGFGFPPLEALACGTPVLASDIPVHREILDDAAWFFQADSVDALEELLRHKLAQPDSLVEKRQVGWDRARFFSWENAARKHIALYRSLVA
ncbi:glycosyltransferase family 4 protein [bacterium]|nr:glycosyltransferase family 4 protein [candidate division CSSED10-310 bacterium]